MRVFIYVAYIMGFFLPTFACTVCVLHACYYFDAIHTNKLMIYCSTTSVTISSKKIKLTSITVVTC